MSPPTQQRPLRDFLIVAIGSLVFFLFVFWLGHSVFAETAPTPINPARHALAWDGVTTNADGTPCTDLSHYVVAVSSPTVDLNMSGEPISSINSNCPGVDCQENLNELLQSVADGPLRFWVAAVDASGNQSSWSQPLNVVIDRVGPASPTGLKIRVVVTVEVSQP